MAAKSRSAIYYAAHPEARRKKNAYQQEFNKQPSQVKKRVQLNAFNRKNKGKPGSIKGDGLDASHKGSKIVGYSKQSRNRGDRNNTIGDSRSRGKRIIRRKK